jgi:hypothetical protein
MIGGMPSWRLRRLGASATSDLSVSDLALRKDSVSLKARLPAYLIGNAERAFSLLMGVDKNTARHVDDERIKYA